LTLLRALGIASQISSCSYRRGRHAYLEEDNDLSAFVTACHAHNIHPKWLEEHTNHDSPIRSYSHYSPRPEDSKTLPIIFDGENPI
jgi:hypothetical protein